MNQDNLDLWLTDLYETTAPQGQGHLICKTGDPIEPYEFCCLGRGEVVRGIAPGDDVLSDDEGLASTAFVVWLGLDTQERGTEVWYPVTEALGYASWDVVLDVDSTLASLIPPTSRETVTCAGLNDEWHLTFPQIADMIRYFGIKGAR